MSQEVLLVDLAHLIPWHLLHQHQACGDGVGRHVFPAINTGVNKLMTVYFRNTQTKLIQAYTGTHITPTRWEHAHAHICNNKKENKTENNCKTKASPVAE